MAGDWASPSKGYGDLATKADQIYAASMRDAGQAENDSGIAKHRDTALKALRFIAEIRAKESLPAEVAELRELRDQIVEAIAISHGSSSAYVGETPTSSGDPEPN